jgi:hypothetical protein
VGAPHLEEALDRFAQFFIAPLFTVGATEREMNGTTLMCLSSYRALFSKKCHVVRWYE